MIDTIVLAIPPGQFLITDHYKFSPSSAGLFQPPFYRMGPQGFMKCVQYPTKADLKDGVYKPSLTVIRRHQAGALVNVLKIQFSAPKLLFGNNFDELKDTDFNSIISRLHEILPSMGVMVTPATLRPASVSAIHFAKNILLTDHTTPAMILNELAKIDLNQRLDLNHTDYRNEGHGLKYHANAYEIAFYDKLQDLRKARTSDKRALEDDNAIQLGLLDNIQSLGAFEVFRMEVRLNTRPKAKQILEKLNICSNQTFQSLFKSDTAQKVLLFYLRQIKQGYRHLSYQPKTPQEFMMQFKMLNPQVKCRHMLQAYAARALIKEIGIRSLREALNIYGSQMWSKINHNLEKYKFPEGDLNPFKLLEESLNKFEPVRMSAIVNNTTQSSNCNKENHHAGNNL